jgi:hypothetical protein
MKYLKIFIKDFCKFLSRFDYFRIMDPNATGNLEPHAGKILRYRMTFISEQSHPVENRLLVDRPEKWPATYAG